MKEDENMIDDRKYPIVMFGNEMFKELEKHDLEKNLKFYSMSVDRLYHLLHDQANSRLQKVSQTIFREDLPLIEIERQSIHLANYCYFLWSQARRMREKND